MLDPTTRTTLLDLARRYLAAPCCDDGTALARAVVAALDTPASAPPGRVWRKGEACPIVAEGQVRQCSLSGGAYTVGRRDGIDFEVRWAYGMRTYYLAKSIAPDVLIHDWHEPIPLADTLPRVEVTPCA